MNHAHSWYVCPGRESVASQWICTCGELFPRLASIGACVLYRIAINRACRALTIGVLRVWITAAYRAHEREYRLHTAGPCDAETPCAAG